MFVGVPSEQFRRIIGWFAFLTLGLVFDVLSRPPHWKVERELTENQEELEPEDFTEERERKEPLDRTERVEPQLEAGK